MLYTFLYHKIPKIQPVNKTNNISASRLKHYLADNFMLGSTFTSRTGFITESSQEMDSQNFVAGMDLGYEITDGLKAQAGITQPVGHHNFSGEFRYLPSKEDELILEYAEGNTSAIGSMRLDPYGGSMLTLDTQHIIRAYYRRRFKFARISYVASLRNLCAH